MGKAGTLALDLDIVNGDGVSNWPSAARLTLSDDLLGRIALSQRILRTLGEPGASLTLSLGDSSIAFLDGDEPWPRSESTEGDPTESDEVEDAFGHSNSSFDPSSIWLEVDVHGIGLEVWERHSDATLHGMTDRNQAPELFAHHDGLADHEGARFAEALAKADSDSQEGAARPSPQG